MSTIFQKYYKHITNTLQTDFDSDFDPDSDSDFDSDFPSFRHSVIPSFRHSVIPSFKEKLEKRNDGLQGPKLFWKLGWWGNIHFWLSPSIVWEPRLGHLKETRLGRGFGGNRGGGEISISGDHRLESGGHFQAL